MTLHWVRRQYGVPAAIGRIIRFEGRPARILSATNLLHVRFLDSQRPRSGYLHPVWHVDWSEPTGEHPVLEERAAGRPLPEVTGSGRPAGPKQRPAG